MNCINDTLTSTIYVLYNYVHVSVYSICIESLARLLWHVFSLAHHSKGDIEGAVKCLELYVGVTEKVGDQESQARACSAIGTMCNTLVSEWLYVHVRTCAYYSQKMLYRYSQLVM